MKPKLSLKGRGLQILALREHSRSELRRKLLAHVRDEHARAEHARADEASTAESAVEQVEAALDWLQSKHYLCEERFVESRVHARAQRFGNLRIRSELAQHGVALSAEAAQQLAATELARAQDVWARKFGQTAADAAERARQVRFMAARGFSGDVIRRVIQGTEKG